jgi:hypothetical protein
MSEQPPDLLTIEEAARVLRIGRTKAYAMSQEWRVTNGESGIKVCELGGQLRVPRAWLEEQLGAPVLVVPSVPDRARRNGQTPKRAAPQSDPAPAAELAQPTKQPTPRRRGKRSTANSNQLTLPFS